MPELPEITILSQQLDRELRGETIQEVGCSQPKCLNQPLAVYRRQLRGERFISFTPRGKWLLAELTGGRSLLLNLGMGADLLYFNTLDRLPPKYQFQLTTASGRGFTIYFWWFGKAHLAETEAVRQHPEVGSLGPSPLDPDFTLSKFSALVKGKKGGIKNFLLKQQHLCGIGNVYIQEILFQASLHPLTPIPSLTQEQIARLFIALREVPQASIAQGGLSFEKDFYGQRGGYIMEKMSVGYQAGSPCPRCGAVIQKIKTGATSHYICPRCQRL